MKFSTLTKEELADSYKNLHDLDLNNAIAGETRHILDWYYGINLSRALMQAVKKAKNWHKIFSIGRVQGPTLSLIVNLEKKIMSFTPKEYYVINALIKSTTFVYENDAIFDKEEAHKIFAAAQNQDARITKFETEQLQFWPFPPFNLTDLQTEAYRVYKFSPAYTLDLAQSLYEKSLISYPRTSSQKLPQALNTKKILTLLAKNAEYKKIIERLKNTSKPIQGKKDDPAHPAIHPTGYYSDMTSQEKKIYELIVKRFIACFGEPAIREKRKAVANINGLIFNAAGIKTISQGWLDIYKFYKPEDNSIDNFTIGEVIKPTKIEIHKKMTKPPSRYTQASLISELERLNLGTKATRAAIIDTLYERGYIHGKTIKATTLGIKVHDALMAYAKEILDVELTRELEEKMEHIIDSNVKSEDVLQEGKTVIMKILADFKKHEKEIGNALADGIVQSDKEKAIVGKCNLCQNGTLMLRFSPKNKKFFVGCSEYPLCKNVFSLPIGKIETTGKTCEYCNTPIIKVIRKNKKTFEMCLTYTCKSKENWSKPTNKK